MTNLEELIKSFEAKQKEFIAEAQKELSESFKQVFELVPDLLTIKWTQYTPYFNDGEECIFEVHDPIFMTRTHLETLKKDHNMDEEDVLDCMISDEFGLCFWWSPDSEYARRDREESGLSFDEYNALMSLSKTITSQSLRPVLQVMFGEHAIVVATKDGIESEEYDHD